MKLAIIVAIAENGIIGKEGGIPWYIPEDLKRFKQLTSGHTVVMGRKTYLSILERLKKPLPNRTNIVLSNDPNFKSNGQIIVARSFSDAITTAAERNTEIYFIGGQEVYKRALDVANFMHITHVRRSYQGDVFFPEYNKEEWQEVLRQDHAGFSFVDYERKYKHE